jgi:hypothetical protein
VSANVYDSLFTDGDVLDTNVTQWLGTAAATPTTAGVPEVDVTFVSGTAQTAGDIAALVVTADAAIDALIATVGTSGANLTDLGGMSTAMKAEILAEVNAALDTAVPELTGVPAATPSLRVAAMLLYMMARNKFVTQTSATDAIEVHNDAGTKIVSKLITDVTGDYTEAKMA